MVQYHDMNQKDISRSSNPCVLVADDDAGILEVMKIILEENKYTVIPVAQAMHVIDVIRKESPNIVLIDITMAGVSGAEITKTIKKDKTLASIPIIIVSARQETEQIAKEAGATDFLLKPFDIENLVAIVKKYTS